MKTSESIVKISPALLKAQKEMGAVTKDSANPFFKSNYANLEAVIEAVKGPLNSNGIVFLQPTKGSPNGVIVETVLLHESGEWIADELELPVDKKTAQATGSAVSYGRRYGLQALVGLPSTEDDDGNHASGLNKPTTTPQGAPTQAKPPQKPLYSNDRDRY